MFKLYLIALICFPATLFAQIISGKVYDAESTVNGVKIINLTQNFMVYADEEGNFKIEAYLNDQIAFTTLFHEPQMIIVTQKDFDDVMVVELKKKVNELDKVYLNKINEKTFDSSKVENQMHTQIKKDIQLRPELYSPPPNTNMDLIAIGGLIAKLFKNKSKAQPVIMANYNDFKVFFKSDPFFNSEFLISDLKIESQFHDLFFDFCDAKGIENRILIKENKFLLLEIFYQFGPEFLKAIKE